MIEKVNPCHPDKVADRIAGALVDLAYNEDTNHKCAIEVLLGHNECTIITESSYNYKKEDVVKIVNRIAGEGLKVHLKSVKQDEHLSANQKEEVRCGDNGIFKGMPLTAEQKKLSKIARGIYAKYPTDGKYILANNKLIICQSCAKNEDLRKLYPKAVINPLGEWTGGPNVDSGCTNRKLGSDMADSVTGGGLHGKDLSKSDVSVNIYAFLKAQKEKRPIELFCAIGDKEIDGKPYSEIVKIAEKYILKIGGFEKFAEWGLY